MNKVLKKMPARILVIITAIALVLTMIPAQQAYAAPSQSGYFFSISNNIDVTGFLKNNIVGGNSQYIQTANNANPAANQYTTNIYENDYYYQTYAIKGYYSSLKYTNPLEKIIVNGTDVPIPFSVSGVTHIDLSKEAGVPAGGFKLILNPSGNTQRFIVNDTPEGIFVYPDYRYLNAKKMNDIHVEFVWAQRSKKQHAPTLASGVNATAAAIVDKNSAYELNLAEIFNDADGDALEYTVSGEPTYTVNANTNAVTRTANTAKKDVPSNYSFTPLKGAIDETLVFTAFDKRPDAKPVTYTVTLTVNNTNKAPTLRSGVSSTATSSVRKGSALTSRNLGTTVFVDPDGDAMTYTVSVNGRDPVAQAASFSLTAAQTLALEEGPNTYKFTAKDANDAASTQTHTLTVYVYSDNHAPVLRDGVSDHATVSLRRGSAYTINLESSIFKDIDDDTLKYDVKIGDDEPFEYTGASYTISGATSAAFTAGEDLTYIFTAKDALGESSDAYTLTLRIYDSNRAPKFRPAGLGVTDPAPTIQLRKGKPYSKTFYMGSYTDALFIDPDGDAMTYRVQIDDDEPQSFTDISYFLNITAQQSSELLEGSHTYKLWATDTLGENSPIYSITFNIYAANNAPVVRSGAPSDIEWKKGLAYSLDLANKVFSDSDGDTLTYTVAIDGAATPVTVSGTTYTIAAATSNVFMDDGVHTYLFEAKDPDEATVSHTVSIDFKSTKILPRLADGSPSELQTTIRLGSIYYVMGLGQANGGVGPIFVDPMSGTPIRNYLVKINDNDETEVSNATASYTIPAASLAEGENTVVFRAKTTAGDISTETYTVKINAVYSNAVPEFKPGVSGTVNFTLRLGAPSWGYIDMAFIQSNFEDPDGTPVWDYQVSTDGGITWSGDIYGGYTLNNSQVGSYDLKIRAKDSFAGAKPDDTYSTDILNVHVDVVDTNAIPRLINPANNLVSVGSAVRLGSATQSLVNLSNYFEDPDGDTMTYLFSTDGGYYYYLSNALTESVIYQRLLPKLTPGLNILRFKAKDAKSISTDVLTVIVNVAINNSAPQLKPGVTSLTLNRKTTDTSSIYLANYFEDPDNDVILYQISTDGGDTFDIELAQNQPYFHPGSQANGNKILPEGRYDVVIRAVDPYGLEATLNMDLTIQSVQPPQLLKETSQVTRAASSQFYFARETAGFFEDLNGDFIDGYYYKLTNSDGVIVSASPNVGRPSSTHGFSLPAVPGQYTLEIQAGKSLGSPAVYYLSSPHTMQITVTAANAPVIKEGVQTRVTNNIAASNTFKINLNNIFEDPNGYASLRYRVSIEEAEPTVIDGVTYTGKFATRDYPYTLEFSAIRQAYANVIPWPEDSVSETYTVELWVSDVGVTFRLIGATKSTAPIDLGAAAGDYKGSTYETWIPTTTYQVSSTTTAGDLFIKALERAGLSSKGAPTYVTGINAPATLGGYELKADTNGLYGGWQYEVNGEAADVGLDGYVLQDGDEVVFHYVNDWRYENIGEWYLGDTSTAGKWLNAADVKPESLPVVKTDLNADITAADTQIASLNAADYTADSWKALQEALSSAKQVAAKESATRAEVQSAQAALVQALAGLTKKEDSKVTEKEDSKVTEPKPTGPSITDPADVSTLTIFISKSVAWTGKQQKPKIAVKDGAKTLVANTDYTLAYGANKNIGPGTATIKGNGNYKGTKALTFKILPGKVALSKLTAGKKQMKVVWKKGNAKQKLTGYTISYKIKGAKKWSTKTVTAKKANLIIKKLKKGKAYQVCVQAYKTVKEGGKSVKYAGAWSSIKTSKKVG